MASIVGVLALDLTFLAVILCILGAIELALLDEKVSVSIDVFIS